MSVQRDGGLPILIANPGADLYGSDRMLLETVSSLVAEGEQVIVTVPSPGPLITELARRGAETVITPTPIIRKSALRPKGLAALLWSATKSVLPGLALLRRHRPRVIVVNTITPPLWLLLARLMGIPAVCHVHEGEASVSPWLRAALAAPLLLANRLIVNSQFSCDVLTGAFPQLGDRADIIYNAVQGPESVVPPRATLDSPVRLLYVGRLSPRKGPQIALEAVRILTERGLEVRLDVVGAVYPGYEWFDEELREIVSANGLRERVVFHGFRSDVWRYAAQADINLVPSTLDEPFGNTAVEAALAARPLVVSRSGGLIEASSGLRSCIRVDPGSADQLADAVQAMVDRWPEYSDQALADSATAADRYSFERYRESVARVVAGLT